ncbi:MAG: LytTR family DNA-binding domain-containing protein [Eubacteriales bacterium]|nr:LytTR family DNA-binding domain-containing protein [Lachnospiraceae bacterium]MDO5127330.1 LytTR family DNA-binding domain-containing protein [Eubacteriales bacterium]
MVTLLIYGCKQKEFDIMQKKSADLVARLSDEKLVVGSSLDMEHEPNLAIVNICADGGLDLAYQVRERYKDVAIMLVSDTSISPMQYLNPVIRPISLVICPYSDSELDSVLTDFISKRLDDNDDAIWVDGYDGKVKISYNNILYVEASQKMLNIRLETVEYSVYGSLEQFEKKLPATFARCHRSMIVNTRFIDKIRFSENYIRLKNGEQVPMSRTYKQNFKEMMKG